MAWLSYINWFMGHGEIPYMVNYYYDYDIASLSNMVSLSGSPWRTSTITEYKKMYILVRFFERASQCEFGVLKKMISGHHWRKKHNVCMLVEGPCLPRRTSA